MKHPLNNITTRFGCSKAGVMYYMLPDSDAVKHGADKIVDTVFVVGI